MTVIQFRRPVPSNDPPQAPSRKMEPPSGQDPHTFYSSTLRMWSVWAEKRCGAKWCLAVISNLAAYFEARVAMGADIGRDKT